MSDLKQIVTSYKNIFLVRNTRSGLNQIVELLGVPCDCIKISTADKASAALFCCTESTLIAIDVNSIGIRKTDYILFLLACFFPYLSAVLVASELSEKAHERYLASGVVAIIQGEGPATVVCAAA